MSNFLDKLAMRVGKWASGPMPGTWIMSASTPDITARSLDQSETVNEQQWLQRRKEIINEPDDAGAPEWANWKAQDSDGRWSWYEAKPTISSTHWNYSDGSDADDACQGKIPAGHDWRTTLKEVNRMADLKEVRLAWAAGKAARGVWNDRTF